MASFLKISQIVIVVWNKVAVECFDILKSEGHIAYNSSGELIAMCQFLVSGYTLYQLPNNSSLKIDKNGLDLVNMIMLFSLRGMGMSEDSIEKLYNPLKFRNKLREWAEKRLTSKKYLSSLNRINYVVIAFLISCAYSQKIL